MAAPESGLRKDETRALISSEKVEGTAVYDPSGEKIGTVHDLMIDKVGGNVAYVVVSAGGFLGMGDKRLPLPWNTLTYDVNREGYVSSSSRDTLTGGPAYASDEEIDWHDPEFETRVHKHYDAVPPWRA